MPFALGEELPALGTMEDSTFGTTPIVAEVVAVNGVVNSASSRPSLFNLCISGGVLDAAELFGLNGCP